MQRIASQLRFATARLATGPRIRYAEQGDPSGEPIVFLHGYTDSSYSFSRLLPLLAPDRYHAYALDQRGHGDSERPAAGYTPLEFAADVVAFLDAAGVERATVVGHSMGSFIARSVAERYPERVSRLVLIGTAATPINEATREFQQVVQTLVDPVPAAFVREFQISTAHVPLPEPFLERVVAESLKLPAAVWQRALDGLLAADDADQLSSIAAPTLIIWGEQDAIFPREAQDRLTSAIPDARLIVYPETGHAPHWERPERVARDIAAFLADTPPSD